jgi:hypothetical protein
VSSTLSDPIRVIADSAMLATLSNGSTLHACRIGAHWIAQVTHMDGSAYSDPFPLNTAPLSADSRIAAAALHGRSVAIAWTDTGLPAQRALYLRVIDLIGLDVGAGSVFPVEQGLAGSLPALRALSPERFVLAWAGCLGHAGARLHVCVLDATGRPVRPPQPLGSVLQPPCEILLTALPSAGIVVAWRDGSANGAQATFCTQMLDPSGARIGDECVCGFRD